MKKTLSSLSLLTLTFMLSCSSAPSMTPPKDIALDSLDLFMSRSSLLDTEFEQFKLSGSDLYKECGKIRRGRFLAEVQDLSTIDPNTSNRIRVAAAAVLEAIKAGGAELDKPGTNSSLFDPGQFYLSINAKDDRVSAKTSLDSISNAVSGREEKMQKLAITMREAAGGKLCGNQQFYGVGDKKP